VFEDVIGNVDAYKKPSVDHVGDDASSVRATCAVAKDRNDVPTRAEAGYLTSMSDQRFRENIPSNANGPGPQSTIAAKHAK
jgi:hypothetical protein